MFCKNCGEENPENAVYCRNCGAKLVEDVKKTTVIETEIPSQKEKAPIQQQITLPPRTVQMSWVAAYA